MVVIVGGSMDSKSIIQSILEQLKKENICFAKCQSYNSCSGRTKEGAVKKLDSIFSSNEEYDFLFSDMYGSRLGKPPLVKRTVDVENGIAQITLLSPILTDGSNAMNIRVLK